MKTCTTVFFLLTALLSTAAFAQTFVFAGALDDSDRPADGLFTIDFELIDEDSNVIWSEQQANVVVVGGVFAVDVGANAPLPNEIPGRSRLVMTIDGDELPPVPLARFASAIGAFRAGQAASSPTTLALNGVTAVEAATREGLLAAGGTPVAFANITGVAASVRDGDQGTDVASTSADFAVSARTLSLATVNGSRLAAGAVTGARFSTGALGAAAVQDGAITGAKVANGSLAPSRLSVDVTAREVKTATVYFVAAGCAGANNLTDARTCRTQSCSLNGGVGGSRSCDGNSCVLTRVTNPLICSNEIVGELVLE